MKGFQVKQRKYVTERRKPLSQALDASERDYLNGWISNREWVSPQLVWTHGLRRDFDEYDSGYAIMVSHLLREELGWVKNGQRAHYEGERHWVYVPKGSQYNQGSQRRHVSEVSLDTVAILKWLKNRSYTTPAEILHRAFRVFVPKVLDSMTVDSVSQISQFLTDSGWYPCGTNKDAVYVMYRRGVMSEDAFTQLADILG